MKHCFNCDYHIGGIQCRIYGSINKDIYLHGKKCNSYQEKLIRFYPK